MDLQIDLCVGAMVIKKTSKFPPMELHIDLWVYNGRKISKFPPPWNFKFTFECVQWSEEDMKKCTPMELQLDLGVCAMFRRYQNSHPHGTSNWPWVCAMVRRYQNFHPRGTSNWPWVCTMVRRYQKSHPRETSDNLWVCTMVRRYQNSHVQW